MATYCELTTGSVPNTHAQPMTVSVDRVGDGPVFISLLVEGKMTPEIPLVLAMSPELAIAFASSVIDAAAGKTWCAA